MITLKTGDKVEVIAGSSPFTQSVKVNDEAETGISGININIGAGRIPIMTVTYNMIPGKNMREGDGQVTTIGYYVSKQEMADFLEWRMKTGGLF